MDSSSALPHLVLPLSPSSLAVQQSGTNFLQTRAKQIQNNKTFLELYMNMDQPVGNLAAETAAESVAESQQTEKLPLGRMISLRTFMEHKASVELSMFNLVPPPMLWHF